MARELTQRVQKTAVQRQQPDQPKSLYQLIEEMKPEIGRALPKHMDPDRVARIAMTLARSTPALLQCTPQSFLGALMTASQLGLEPGPLGEAYLVPYGRVCTFIPGYKGLIKLAWQSNQMKNIDAHVVYENDDFDFAYGLDPFLHHKPTRKTRGEITEVYACASFLNGGSAFVVMSIDDVEAIRKRSKASQNGPWVTDWNAMAQKTGIKQLSKFLPMSTDLRQFAQAISLDGTARSDVGALDDVMPDYVDGEVVPEQAGAESPAVIREDGDNAGPSQDEVDEYEALAAARAAEEAEAAS